MAHWKHAHYAFVCLLVLSSAEIANSAPAQPKASASKTQKVKQAPTTQKAQPTKVAPSVRKAAPVVRKAAPVVRKAAPVVRKAAPVVRKAAPVVRKVTKIVPVARKTAPVVRTKPVVRKKSVTTTQKTWNQTYDMVFRGKKVGEYVRNEQHQKDGTIVVKNKSRLTINMLFAKVTAINSSHCIYNSKGKLQSFSITSTVRNQTTRIKGKQTDKGLTIERSKGKKSEKKFFAAEQYQSTSLDLRFPTAVPGVKFTRKHLIIPRLRIVSQTISFRAAPAGNVFGKKQPLIEMIMHNKKGKGILLLTRDGKMAASKMKGLLGRVEIRIKKGN